MVDRGSFTKQEIQFLDERITIQGRVIPKRLPKDFVPGNWTIICGRGKECYNHIGNRRLRILVEVNLAKYSATKSKFQKTLIVSSIVDAVRSASPVGGFVKHQPKTKTYVEIGDDVARERVGQLFRESLTRKNPAKLNARKEKRRAQARKNKAREEKRDSLAAAKTEKSNSSAVSVSEESVDMTSSVAVSTSASVSAGDSSVAESLYTALSVIPGPTPVSLGVTKKMTSSVAVSTSSSISGSSAAESLYTALSAIPEPTPLSPSVSMKHMEIKERFGDMNARLTAANTNPASFPGTGSFAKYHFDGGNTTLAALVSPSNSLEPTGIPAFSSKPLDFCLVSDLFDDDSDPLPLLDANTKANAMANPNPFSFTDLAF